MSNASSGRGCLSESKPVLGQAGSALCALGGPLSSGRVGARGPEASCWPAHPPRTSSQLPSTCVICPPPPTYLPLHAHASFAETHDLGFSHRV